MSGCPGTREAGFPSFVMCAQVQRANEVASLVTLPTRRQSVRRVVDPRIGQQLQAAVQPLLVQRPARCVERRDLNVPHERTCSSLLACESAVHSNADIQISKVSESLTKQGRGDKEKGSKRRQKARKVEIEKACKKLHPLLQNYATSLGFRAQREEIANETIKRILPKWGTFDNLNAYAMTVLRNYLRDNGANIRRNQGQLTDDDLLLGQLGPVMRDPSDEISELVDIQRAINSLPLDLKEIVFLIYFCDLSKKAIAKHLEISTRTVARRYNQARDMLAGILYTPELRPSDIDPQSGRPS
jgi:RNA polymerase sigma factor (sigma-70 family)